MLGMMPHPERAADPLMGSTDGLVILQSMVARAGSQMKMTAITPDVIAAHQLTPDEYDRSSRFSAANPTTPSSASSA